MRTYRAIDEFPILVGSFIGRTKSGVAAEPFLRLTSGNDNYRSGDGDDRILALGGDDHVRGERGDDIILGGQGDDSLEGAQGRDKLYGGEGADLLAGGAGRDRLYGGGGDDVIFGDTSRDLLCGGLGADQIALGRTTGGNAFSDGLRDTVIYKSAADSTSTQTDRISEFRTGEDRVDLHLIDADVSTPVNDAFRFIGNAAFSGAAGDLRFGDAGPFHTLLLQGDVDGDGQADFVVQFSLTGVGNDALHAGDFVL